MSAGIHSSQPRKQWIYSFPERRVRRLRVVQTGTTTIPEDTVGCSRVEVLPRRRRIAAPSRVALAGPSQSVGRANGVRQFRSHPLEKLGDAASGYVHRSGLRPRAAGGSGARRTVGPGLDCSHARGGDGRERACGRRCLLAKSCASSNTWGRCAEPPHLNFTRTEWTTCCSRIPILARRTLQTIRRVGE